PSHCGLLPLADINEMAGNSSCSSHGGRHQVRAPLEALTAFEIAVRSRGAAFLRLKLVGVHGKAHRATWLPPLKACIKKNLVQTFSFRLILDQAGAWHDHGVDARGNLAVANHCG